ncbi:GXWXG domain-containing protein [Ensifer sp. ENS11]|uniref:GXWXG domain-containing protein n=1 Tax=Ensifer sp. ENS11 TaxID=2769291 RepID=UPI0017875461|nr:GXWXG domain-containing protein [Ensifer sp. ENS11]MBD9491552.1 GXWXG domain-containing protein [Ensifer sp. ENS11]
MCDCGSIEKVSRPCPVDINELVGLWRASGEPTGYPLDDVLETLGWFGKRFHTNLRADGMRGKTGRLTLWGAGAMKRARDRPAHSQLPKLLSHTNVPPAPASN